MIKSVFGSFLALAIAISVTGCVGMGGPRPLPQPLPHFIPQPILLHDTPKFPHRAPVVVVAARPGWIWKPMLTFTDPLAELHSALPGDHRPELLTLGGDSPADTDPERISAHATEQPTPQAPIGMVFRHGQLVFTFDGSQSDTHIEGWAIHYLDVEKRRSVPRRGTPVATINP